MCILKKSNLLKYFLSFLFAGTSPRTPSSFIGIKEPKELHLMNHNFLRVIKYRYYFIYSKSINLKHYHFLFKCLNCSLVASIISSNVMFSLPNSLSNSSSFLLSSSNAFSLSLFCFWSFLALSNNCSSV